jgi:hypothetical protein
VPHGGNSVLPLPRASSFQGLASGKWSDMGGTAKRVAVTACLTYSRPQIGSLAALGLHLQAAFAPPHLLCDIPHRMWAGWAAPHGALLLALFSWTPVWLQQDAIVAANTDVSQGAWQSALVHSMHSPPLCLYSNSRTQLVRRLLVPASCCSQSRKEAHCR